MYSLSDLISQDPKILTCSHSCVIFAWAGQLELTSATFALLWRLIQLRIIRKQCRTQLKVLVFGVSEQALRITLPAASEQTTAECALGTFEYLGDGRALIRDDAQLLRSQEKLEGKDADVAQPDHFCEVDDVSVDAAEQDSVVWLAQIQNVHDQEAHL